jgi:hypothetical protein
MKLYPCVLLGDFGTARLADTLGTEQQYRWSTSDTTNFNIDLTRAKAMWDRKSLRIATGTSTTTGDEAVYGDAGTALTELDVMNAFGNDVNDFTWCTNLACWMYNTDDVYSGGDPDQFKMIMDNGGTQIDVYWTSDFDTADKWIWVSGTPGAGSFTSNGDNVERFGYAATAAFTASSYFYLSTFVAYRSTLSTTSDDYVASNALEVVSTSVTPNTWNAWDVNGIIRGDRVVDQVQQLQQMETIGLAALNPIRRPSPKYQALMDCGNIKTYLMEVEGTMGQSTLTRKICIPIIITGLSIDWIAPSQRSAKFRFTALRFAGV